VGAKTYYFSPGGSLYRTDPELNKEDVASVFSGYLGDELNLRRWVFQVSVSVEVGDQAQV
jgi:hypothetical protein